MKKVLLIFLFVVLSLCVTSQIPQAFSVQGGYSWINGTIGVEYQIGHLGISGGWAPTTMSIYGVRINTYGFAGTYYTDVYNEFSGYCSVGIASQALRYANAEDDISTSSMTIVMVGFKEGGDIINFKFGGGYGWCNRWRCLTFEATMGIVLFGNSKTHNL